MSRYLQALQPCQRSILQRNSVTGNSLKSWINPYLLLSLERIESEVTRHAALRYFENKIMSLFEINFASAVLITGRPATVHVNISN